MRENSTFLADVRATLAHTRRPLPFGTLRERVTRTNNRPTPWPTLDVAGIRQPSLPHLIYLPPAFHTPPKMSRKCKCMCTRQTHSQNFDIFSNLHMKATFSLARSCTYIWIKGFWWNSHLLWFEHSKPSANVYEKKKLFMNTWHIQQYTYTHIHILRFRFFFSVGATNANLFGRLSRIVSQRWGTSVGHTYEKKRLTDSRKPLRFVRARAIH